MKVIKNGNGDVVAWRHWMKWYVSPEMTITFRKLKRGL